MHRFPNILLLLALSLGLSGCELIADIFQAGVFVGVILVLAVIIGIWLIVRILR